MAGLKPEFDKRNTKIIGLSVDPVDNHAKWAKDIEETQGHAVNYPMIGDTELKVAKAYDMLPEGAGTTSDGRTAADNATVRSVFVIGPDKKIKAMLTYPMSTGRNFDEVLRLLDSCQLTAKHKVATPVNWKPGEDVIIPPAVSNEQAAAKYPNGWKTVKPYLRVVAQPGTDTRRRKDRLSDESPKQVRRSTLKLPRCHPREKPALAKAGAGTQPGFPLFRGNDNRGHRQCADIARWSIDCRRWSP